MDKIIKCIKELSKAGVVATDTMSWIPSVLMTSESFLKMFEDYTEEDIDGVFDKRLRHEEDDIEFVCLIEKEDSNE